MIVKVHEHKVEIIKTPVNEKEVNVTKCIFQFDEIIPNNYVKKAFFTLNGNAYEQIIVNNECDIPNEVLLKKGSIELGVVAYKVENEELIQRFNPSPDYFDSWSGSLKQATNTEPITPTDKEQIESAITDLQNTKQDTLVSGENIKTINNESLLGSGNLEVITDLSDYYTKEQTDDLLDNKVDNSALNNYYQKNETYNKNEIDSIKTTIEGEIPISTSDLENDSGFITKSVNDLENYSKTSEMNSAISSAVSTETTNRQNSDIALQNQIDAITSSSDVVDVVSTYQDLLDYDTSKLTDKDVIKVMQDSTHSNAISYYRWNTSTFDYIGSEGPFYTKGETDTLLNQKANTSDIPDLTNYVKNTDYATDSKGGVIRISTPNGSQISSGGILQASTRNYSQYNSDANTLFIGKGTLENVITGKELVNQTTLNESQEEQNETINELETKLQETQAELERYKLIENALPKVSGTGTSITLDNTANAGMTLELNPSELEQETTTGKNLANLDTSNTKTIGGVSFTINEGVIYINGTPEENKNFYFPNFQTNSGSAVFWIENTGYINAESGNDSIILQQSDDGISNWSKLSEISLKSGVTKQSSITLDSSKYYRIRWYANANTYTNATIKVMLEYGNSQTTWEKYTGGIASPNPQYPQDIHTISGDNTIKVIGSQLWDEEWELGGINATTGQDSVSTTVIRSKNYIPVQPSTDYYYYNGTDAMWVFAYDKNKNFLGYATGNSSSVSNISKPTPSECYYIRFQCRSQYGTTYLNNIMINKGTTALPYEPHQEQTANVKLRSNNIAQPETSDYFEYINGLFKNTSTDIRNYFYAQIRMLYDTNGYHLAGTNTEATKNFGLSASSPLNQTYSLTFTTTATTKYIMIGHNGSQTNLFTNALAKVKPNTTYTASFNLIKNNPTILNGIEFNEIMLNEGSEALPYDEFYDYGEYCKIGNYKDQFYKATDSDTGLISGKWYLKKNIGKITYDGTEYWELNNSFTNVFTRAKPNNAESINNMYSNYFKQLSSLSVNESGMRIGTNINLKHLDYTSVDEFKNWLSTHNTIVYYILSTSTYTLLNDTLQEQLEYIYNQMLSYQGQTNITQVSNDLPFDIVATALKDLSSL